VYLDCFPPVLKGVTFPLAAVDVDVAVDVVALGFRWYSESPSPRIPFSSKGVAVGECECEFECEWASVISIPGGIGRVHAEADGENCGKTARMLGVCVCACCSGLLVVVVVIVVGGVAEEGADVVSGIFAKLEEGTGNAGLIGDDVLHGGGGGGGDDDDDKDDKDTVVSVSVITAEAVCDNRLRRLVLLSEDGVFTRVSVVSGL
jgi:hypothetical protein